MFKVTLRYGSFGVEHGTLERWLDVLFFVQMLGPDCGYTGVQITKASGGEVFQINLP